MVDQQRLVLIRVLERRRLGKLIKRLRPRTDGVLVTLRLKQEGDAFINRFRAGKLCLFCDALSFAGDAVECSTAVFIGQQSVADKLPCNGNPALRKIQPLGMWIAGKIINGLGERACCSRNAAQQLGGCKAKTVCV